MDNTKRMIKKVKIDLGVIICILGGVSGIGIIRESIKPNIEYRIDNNEKIIDENISYDKLTRYKLITVVNQDNSKEYYIGKYGEITNKLFSILNDEKYIINDYKVDNNRYVESVEDLDDYLYTLDEVKEEYTPDDIEKIYNDIINYKNNLLTVKKLIY